MFASRFIRWPEISKLAPGLTQAAWYSLLGRNQVPGVEHKADGSGYLVPRRAFLRWLGAHPRYKSSANLRTSQENSPKGSSGHESRSAASKGMRT